MNFKSYWSGLSPEAKTALAERASTSVAYLSQVAHGHRKAGADLIGRLMSANQDITFSMMRADPKAAA